jgi:hypothetical protein
MPGQKHPTEPLPSLPPPVFAAERERIVEHILRAQEELADLRRRVEIMELQIAILTREDLNAPPRG